MAIQCIPLSGVDGGFKVGSDTITDLMEWNMGVATSAINNRSKSNTKGYQATWTGPKFANGGFTVDGTDAKLFVKDVGKFVGYTGFSGGNSMTDGRLYAVNAAVSQMVMSWDWTNQTSQTVYSFVSKYVQAGDELQVTVPTSTTEIKDTSVPKIFKPAFYHPASTNPVTAEFFPLTICGTPLCATTASVTISANPIVLAAHSCSAGWQATAGFEAINVAFQANIICPDITIIPDIGECCDLQLYVDDCDLTKFWDFNYIAITNKDQFNVNISQPGLIGWNLQGQFSIAPCSCDGSQTDGYIKDPSGIYRVGAAPQAA